RYYIGGQYECDVTSSGTKERLYLGGDAYSAPMVYQRVNNGSWTAYNIGRDYLGSVTHIATTSGALVAEYSYDPWGRLRNPAIQAIYTPGTEPALFLGRGYTGHEHLTWFCLINMNARLYDPLVGRFLSPDPYVQAPDFTQNFNRYSYALNNPLKYTDLSGEVIGADDALIIGAIVGAIIGAYSGGVIANEGEYNPIKWNWEGTQTLGYMIAGAAFGGMSGYLGSWIAASGIPFANTLSVMASSLFNSFGTWVYTEGQTPISMSYGFASYDFTNDTWGYLGKRGNSFWQNLGYFAGMMNCLKDVNDLISRTPAKLYTQVSEINLAGDTVFDPISHTAVVDVDNNTLISYGPNGFFKPNETAPSSFLKFALEVRPSTTNYPVPFSLSMASSGFTVNRNLFNFMSKIGNAIPYQGISSNCVNWASLSLWLNGIPNIGIHPFLLHGSMFIYNSGFYNIIPYATLSLF
ncbi:MAG: RHS repeat-associated core domain-containing protein, partial [Bacteroidales bacterium]|nr:RHS repeat-associated core domain-containing protein [Bacteroidales bacterium]